MSSLLPLINLMCPCGIKVLISLKKSYWPQTFEGYVYHTDVLT